MTGLPPTSEPRFLSLDGRPLAPLEWTEMRMVLPLDPETWAEAEVLVNGRPQLPALRRLNDRRSLVVDWPRRSAGTWAIEASLADGRRTAWTVFLRPTKISESALQVLVDDLESRLPCSLALALQRGGALAGLDIRPPEENTPAEEMEKLRRAIYGSESRPGFAALLASIARDPVRILRQEEVLCRLDCVRRPSADGLRRALYRASEIDDRRLPLTLPDRRVVETYDVYENRLVRSLAEMLTRRTRAAQCIAQQEAIALEALVMRARRGAVFLDGVRPLAEPPRQITMVLQRRSDYGHCLRLYRELAARMEVRFDEPVTAAPLADVPQLYETWGVLRAIMHVASIAAGLGWRVEERIAHRAPGTLFLKVLRDGEPALVLRHGDGRVARVVPQRTYGGSGKVLRSLSYDQRPDLALEVAMPGGATSVWLFDPKYKRETAPDRPCKEDIDKMHAYRDALVDADGRAVVRHAAILYPGPHRRFGDNVSALPADPLDADALEKALNPLIQRALS